jgi:hypothetical protein
MLTTRTLAGVATAPEATAGFGLADRFVVRRVVVSAAPAVGFALFLLVFAAILTPGNV